MDLFVENFREYGPIFRSRSRFIPKSDRLLIWLSVVKQNKVFPSTFEVAMLFQYFQGICRGRTCVATFDRSDIRGLFTARPVFIAELPLSSSGSSVNLIP